MGYWYISLLVFIKFGTEGVIAGSYACSRKDLKNHLNTEHNATATESYKNGAIISFKCQVGYNDPNERSMFYQCSQGRWELVSSVITCTLKLGYPSTRVIGDPQTSYTLSDEPTEAPETTLSPTEPVNVSLSTIYAEITSIQASILEPKSSHIYYLGTTNWIGGDLEWSSTVIAVQHPYNLSCNCRVLEAVYYNLTPGMHCSAHGPPIKNMSYNNSLLATWKKFKPPVYEGRYSLAIGSTVYLFLVFGLMYILVLDIPRIVEHFMKNNKIYSREGKLKSIQVSK